MSLNRYVELGTPFNLSVTERDGKMAKFELKQLGKACAQITLRM